MEYKDRVYGETEIDHPLALELMQHPLMARLKGVNQAGYYKPFVGKEMYDRFEHSVGVYLLLRRFGAPLEEQVAGLIHDLSHPVFSHCIDYAVTEGSGEKQNHQDSVFVDYVRKSDIPELLEKYDIDIDYILKEENFPLKEKDLPDLCADRLDYSLRNIVKLKEGDRKEVDRFITSLQVKENRWFFNSISAAQDYAEKFRYMNENYYCNWESALMFGAVGDLVKYCLKEGYLAPRHLFTTDDKILEKVRKHLDDKQLLSLWHRMNNKTEAENNPQNFVREIVCKSRVVDPYFENEKGELVRLSEVDVHWETVIKEESQPKKYFIRYLE